jgi:hypothetical protein
VDRLSPQDAAFLHIENAVNHMHLGVAGGELPEAVPHDR